ncbi:hypothetical protein MA9V1_104 [Chryseobacterium phage MA9V-1]|nr:hypothetical protein MA9V1_104 [Chryseobacterium phage MA9V-1]
MTTILTYTEIYAIYAITVAIFLLTDYVTIGKSGAFRKAMTITRRLAGAAFIVVLLLQIIQYYLQSK